MVRLVFTFAITLYVLLAAWFYFLVASAPCPSGTCFVDMRGILLAPLAISAAASGVLAVALGAYKRASH